MFMIDRSWAMPAGRRAGAGSPAVVQALALWLGVGAAVAATGGRTTDKAAYLPDRSDEALVALVARLDSVPAPFIDGCGAPTICLAIDRKLALGRDEHTITESHVFRVLEPEASPAVTRRLQFSNSTRIEKVGTWILRDGRIIRHGPDSAQIVKGGKDTPTELVIAVPDVRAGDVVGWSYVYRRDYAYYGDTWYLVDVVPTRRATLYMVADDDITYRTFGGNLREGFWRCTVVGKSPTGDDSKVHWSVQDVDCVDDGPLAPPGAAILPSVQVSYTGERRRGRWYRVKSWNDVAYGIDWWFSEVFAEDIDVRKTAVRVTAGLSDPLERLDALRRFVHDRIVIVAPWEAQADVRTAGDVLRQRTADRFMAGILLCAMARELKLPVRPVMARDIDAGPFDDNLHGRLQFTDLLVESLDRPGTYFSAVGTPGPNRELPYHLLGARAMWVESGLQAKVEAIDEAAWQDSKSESFDRYYLEFNRRIRAQKWHTMFTLPGDPGTSQGEVAETVTWRAGSDTLHVELRATGHLDRLDLSPGAPRPNAPLEDYCRWRFPDAALADTVAVDTAGTRYGQLVVSPPQPDGTTWVIPPAFLFGGRFLDEWESADRPQLFCPSTRRHLRVWRLRLPAGWNMVAGPASVSLSDPRLVLLATAMERDGEVVVQREWQWRRGVTTRSGVTPLGQMIDAVRTFEMTPIVLVKE